jgi:hypothetical protein
VASTNKKSIIVLSYRRGRKGVHFYLRPYYMKQNLQITGIAEIAQGDYILL